MNPLVTGATGFIGRALVSRLPGPTVLSRDPAAARARLGVARAFAWDLSAPPPAEAFDGVDAVFHFAAEPLAGNPLERGRKQKVRDTRVTGTQRLVEALAHLERRPEVLVSASAVGVYGSRGDALLDDSAPAGTGALAELAVDWERAALQAEALGVRVVVLRIGLVLGPGGGALAKMLPVFRLGLGGPLGSGRQWMAWIHRDDVAGLAILAARDASLRGPLNAVAPEPVTNAVFTRTLGQVLHRPALLPVPSAALRVAAGADLAAAVLSSERVIPRRALEAGYRFEQPELAAALRDAVSPGAGPARGAGASP